MLKPNTLAATQSATATQFLPLSFLALVTLAARCLTLSNPYFVDGPLHTKAIENGSLVIQPPGYFLFNISGSLLSKVLQISPAVALTLLNVSFGVAAVVVFYLLSKCFLKPREAFFLSLAYSASPLVWFTADIHSTYAAMTFFAPLLFLVMGERRHFILGCFLWALMTGFRPSDGFFVAPWILYQSWDQPWAARIKGFTAGLLGLLLWWIPTMQRFGGTIMSPITTSGSMASHHAQGLLTGGFSVHAATNLLRGVSGMIIAWWLLLPLVAVGAVLLWRERLVRSSLIWMIPGILFFMLYYVADATYFSFCVAPGFIIVGLLLRKLTPPKQTAIYVATVLVAIAFLFTAHPIAPTNKTRAVLDSYFLKYTAWSLRHQYDPRLASLLGACGEAGVLGNCQ